MIKSTAEEEIEYFQSLSYDEKLKYFDDFGIYFLYSSNKLGENDLYVSIRPSNTFELKQYNRWIVNHWRKRFHDDLEISREVGIVRSFKYFDELREYYLSTVFGKSNDNKLGFIQSEIESIGEFVNSFKISRPILSRVYKATLNQLDEEIYTVSYEIANPITKLKAIAKIVDIVKYRIFLRNELNKHSAAKIQAASFIIEPLTNKQLIEIFDFLVLNEFIDSESDRDFFINVFTNQVNDNFSYIKWIDKSQSNYNVNKLTLIALIDHLIGNYTEDRNRFIKTYFKLYQLKKNGIGEREIVEITNESLKQSRKVSNRQKVHRAGTSTRQVKITDKIKAIISGEI